VHGAVAACIAGPPPPPPPRPEQVLLRHRVALPSHSRSTTAPKSGTSAVAGPRTTVGVAHTVTHGFKANVASAQLGPLPAIRESQMAHLFSAGVGNQMNCLELQQY
jgi:hypothetical protein